MAILCPSPVFAGLPHGTVTGSRRKSRHICSSFSKPPQASTTPRLARPVVVPRGVSARTPTIAPSSSRSSSRARVSYSTGMPRSSTHAFSVNQTRENPCDPPT
ncbi:MAG: hypothetical protein JWQ20_3011 [Conexibacter sp.]|nr:hypothetical protein [Conexibacter sp.]